VLWKMPRQVASVSGEWQSGVSLVTCPSN